MPLVQRRVSRASLAALSVLGLAASLAPVTASAADPAIDCVEAGNVWVHVELDGDVTGGCATEFSTGAEALESAGFVVTLDQYGAVATINGMPTPRGTEDWWTYWHNTPGADGVYGGWEFYQVGAAASKPVAGSVDGWRVWHSFSTDAEAPTVNPVAGHVLGETPTPTPSVTPTTSASPSPSASITATPSASPTPTGPGLPHTGN